MKLPKRTYDPNGPYCPIAKISGWSPNGVCGQSMCAWWVTEVEDCSIKVLASNALNEYEEIEEKDEQPEFTIG